MDNNTDNKVKHTQGKWSINLQNKFEVVSKHNGKFSKICNTGHDTDLLKEERIANAELIVKSVNGYSEAIEALKELLLKTEGYSSFDERQIAFNKAKEVIKQSEL